MKLVNEIYNDPIIVLKRKGISEDPYIQITQTLTVHRNYVQLKEIPNRFDRVSIDGLFEVQDNISNKKEYIVDYVNGVIYFHPELNNENVTVKYLGEGVVLLPDSRVFVSANKADATLKDKIIDLDREDLVQKNRIDTLIKESPQPDEIVDLRVDRNGKIYDIARDRLDFEQRIVEDAYKSSDDLVDLPDLHSRIVFDYNQTATKIDNNHTIINSKVNDIYAETSGRLDGLDDFKGEANESIYRLEEVVKNVKLLGAQGDGETNDAEIIQKATKNLSEKGGGTLFFPNGLYKIRIDVFKLYSNVTWKLDDDAVLKVSGTLLRGFATGKGYNGGIKNFSIEGGTIAGDYDRFRQGFDNSPKFLIHHGRYLTFKNVKFSEMAVGHCLDLCGCSDVLIDNCEFLGRYDGIDPSNQYSECVQLDHSTHIGLGYEDESAYEDGLPTANVTIQNCKFLPILNSDGSLKYYAPCPIGNHTQLGRAPHNIIIRGNYFEGVHEIAATNWASKFNGWIHFSTVYDIIVEGNVFNNIYNTRGAAFTCRERTVHDTRWGDNFNPASDSIKNVTIRNNEIKGFKSGGQPGMVGLVTIAGWYGVHEINNISILSNRFINCGKPVQWDAEEMTPVECIDLRQVKNAHIDSNYFFNVDRIMYTTPPHNSVNTWEEETSLMFSNNYIDGVYYNCMNVWHTGGEMNIMNNTYKNIAGSNRIAGNGGKLNIVGNVLHSSDIYNLSNGDGLISDNFIERFFSVNAGERGRAVVVANNVALCNKQVWKCLISLTQPSLTNLRLGQNIVDTPKVQQDY